MDWLLNGEPVLEIPEGYYGFVYIITNKLDNRKYLGKKFFTFARTKIKTVTLKNGTKKKKKIRDRVDSDWKDYYGSSDYLKKDMELVGKENFVREILHLCKTKAECSYRETEEIFGRNALLKEEYYNGWVSAKIHKAHVLGKVEIKGN